jgi:hypothetical protein
MSITIANAYEAPYYIHGNVLDFFKKCKLEISKIDEVR